jgi:hypothetical protein
MFKGNGLYIRGTSAAAESNIKQEVFAVRADLNLDDFAYLIEACGQPSGSIEVSIKTSTNNENWSIRDSAHAGLSIASWIRGAEPPRVPEVYDGGPFSNRC